MNMNVKVLCNNEAINRRQRKSVWRLPSARKSIAHIERNRRIYQFAVANLAGVMSEMGNGSVNIFMPMYSIKVMK